MNYFCPKPSCNRQRLSKINKQGDYICVACGSDYLIDERGRPALKNPIVEKKKG